MKTDRVLTFNFEAANSRYNNLLVMVVRFLLIKAQATVATGVIARRIEVDENFRVTEWTATAVAGDKSVGHWSRWNFVH